MINTLTLKEFQSHRHTELEFHPGVNVVIGQSDSGKTAIIRALNWILFNRPGGDAFIRHGETGASVKLDTDGNEITRYKGKEGNLYKLDGHKFLAVKTDVPLEIKQAFPFEDINIQRQMDAPFVLSWSSGDVAKMLNEMVKLEVIDSTISNLNSDRIKLGHVDESLTDQIARTQTRIDSFQGLDKIGRKLARLEKEQQALKDSEKKEFDLKSLYERIATSDKAVKECVNTKPIVKRLDVLSGKVERQKSLTDKLAQLNRISTELGFFNESIKVNQASIEDCQIRLEKKLKGSCPMCGSKLK